MARPVRVSVTVNGRERTAEVQPRLLLVHFIRETLGLTGTHVGCDSSNCGACTLHLDGEAVKSCTILAVQADGSDITTIEGLAPGMIMAASSLLESNPDPSEEEIRHALEGNLCRCTGYHNIVKAVQAAAKAGSATTA